MTSITSSNTQESQAQILEATKNEQLKQIFKPTKTTYKMKVSEKRQVKIKQAIERANKTLEMSSFDLIEDFNKVVRLERKYNRLQELSCNGYPKEVTEYKNGKMYRYNVENEDLRTKSEKQEETIEKQLQEIASKNNWFIRTQGDPRGATVQIDFFTKRKESEECAHTHILFV